MLTRKLLAVTCVMTAVCCLIWPGCAALKTVEAKRYFDFDDRILTGPPKNGLSLAVMPSTSGPRFIDVLLKNESERRITVNGNFVVDLGAFDASPNLFLYVESLDTGEKVPLRRKKNMNLVHKGEKTNAAWFKLVDPKEYFVVTLDLDDYYDLRDNRQYRVYIEYNNIQTGYKKGGVWVEKYAWVGSIMSNKIILGGKKQGH